MFAVNLMNESKDSTYTDIVSDLKTFSIYNNEESKNAITAIMEMFQMPKNGNTLLAQSTNNLLATWKSFLLNSKSNFVCLMLMLHAYIDNGNLIFDGQNLTDWLSIAEVKGKTIFVLPVSCYNTNADVNPLAYWEQISRFGNVENPPSLRFRQIGNESAEKRISSDGIETIKQCFEISRSFAIEVCKQWKEKNGLNEFYGNNERINLLYGNVSRIITDEFLGINDHFNAAQGILNSEKISIEGFNSEKGPEVKIKAKDIKFEIHVHIKLTGNSNEVILPSFNPDRCPLIKRTKENREKGSKCQGLSKELHEEFLDKLNGKEFTFGSSKYKFIKI